MNIYELKEMKYSYGIDDELSISDIYDKFNDTIVNNKSKIDILIEKIKKLNPNFNSSPYSVVINYNNTDYTNKNVYNILKTNYISKLRLENIKRLYEDYILDFSYQSVKDRTWNYNKKANKELQEIMGSNGKPYGVIVYDFTDIDFNNYLLSANPFKLKSGEIKRTLTFTFKYSGVYNDFDGNINDINKQFKEILKDCYDNEIIIDLGFEKILVISQLPMYKYFNLIENERNVFYEVKPYYYYDEKFYRYIYKNKDDDERDAFDILDSLDYDGKRI